MRRLILFLLILLALVLAGCGGNNDSTPDNTPGVDTTTRAADAPTLDPDAPTPLPPTNTPFPPPVRQRDEPAGEPHAFEPPFSVGSFVRQSLRGNVTAVRAGGQQATYQRDSNLIVLKIYYFAQTANAIATVQDTLNASTVVAQVSEPYLSPSLNFGIVQDKHGAYTAVWNNYQWAFIATAPDSLDALNDFLDIFQY